MAIDREAIIKQIFNGTREPATGWVSPVVDGYKADDCGEFCKFDPAKAKAQLAEAGGFKGGKMTLSYNADASHKEWTEATCNTIKSALGVDCVATPVVDFSTFRTPDPRPEDEGHVPHRLADGLPVDRELPRAALRHGRLVQRRRLQQPGVRRQAQGGRCGHRRCRVEQAVPGGRGAARQRHGVHPAVVLHRPPSGWSDKVTNVKVTPFGVLDYASLSLK